MHCNHDAVIYTRYAGGMVVTFCGTCHTIMSIVPQEGVKIIRLKKKYFFVSLSHAIDYIVKNNIRYDEIECVLCRFTSIYDIKGTVDAYHWTDTYKESLYRTLLHKGLVEPSRCREEIPQEWGVYTVWVDESNPY